VFLAKVIGSVWSSEAGHDPFIAGQSEAPSSRRPASARPLSVAGASSRADRDAAAQPSRIDTSTSSPNAVDR